jgi:ferredoxin
LAYYKLACVDKELKNKKGQVATVNVEDCIGCGVCVYKCPSNSLVLKRKEVLEHPPKNPIELLQRGIAEATSAKE